MIPISTIQKFPAQVIFQSDVQYILVWGDSNNGFMSYDRASKQTDRQTEITTL